MNKTVLVICGGTSSERDVSLRSGAAVVSALERAGYQTATYDPTEGIDSLIEKARKSDICFPVLHGEGGEDGSLQRILESHDITYVGSNSIVSALCFDKLRSKQLYTTLDVQTPEAVLVEYDTYRQHVLSQKPHVLKPFDGGSSIDTFIVRDETTPNNDDIEAAFRRHNSMLLEALIEGTEITVAVMNDKALPVIEIIPPKNQEFDYENKYNGLTQELCPPLHVSSDLQVTAQAIAETIHRKAGCTAMSRTDMIIDSHKNIYVPETNTIPGMTAQSLLPKAALTAGITMPELVDQLVKSALR